ncbi:MAG TPA: desulfoferrodoxin [Lentisphaeria bacterium]|nr:MAG: desulfoferrodoxin [Lentisphaerae bacterium GWF2_49_21]HBC88290.1 desulfoferrodoxin [Lentisphaeria bacterium]
MAKRLEVLKCCKGVTFEVLTDGDCLDITCCGEPVQVVKENSVDAAKEKHVPVIQQGKTGVKIVVGSVAHPMEEKHYIQWIEVINGDYVNRKHLKPGDAPEAEFFVPNTGKLIVRAYCNLHGLWRA